MRVKACISVPFSGTKKNLVAQLPLFKCSISILPNVFLPQTCRCQYHCKIIHGKLIFVLYGTLSIQKCGIDVSSPWTSACKCITPQWLFVSINVERAKIYATLAQRRYRLPDKTKSSCHFVLSQAGITNIIHFAVLLRIKWFIIACYSFYTTNAVR